ncbi:RNaseH domain-containing protein [Antribacter sp. KLBMP9083]|uniref:RNaseH domain-containing protein n=1 Tax=Antribacter soli TaxID=2910976 RepID=A0AA41UDF2_9MICO|nr:RNaseH domain-containing protein [Antribacter soli]MCF4123029.1 RNaseH domain-containing protein [Antribacter soli]
MPDGALEAGKYLDTLALRCTPALIGDTVIYLRELDQETMGLWWQLERAAKQRTGREVQPPHSVATTVLRVITGGFVHFSPQGRFLASLQPIRSTLLERVFTVLEGIVHGIPVEEVDLNEPTRLAARVAATAEQPKSLAEQLAVSEAEQPRVPGWVYDTVGWDLSSRLARKPFQHGDGHAVPLRPDVTGRLVALDDPWVSADGMSYALSRTTVSLKTLPNVSTPVVLLGSSVTRISNSLVFSKTAIGDQGTGKPLLNVSLDGRGGARSVSMFALQTLSRLSMNDTVLHAMSDRLTVEKKVLAERKKGEPLAFFTERPVTIWPVAAKNSRYLSANFGVGAGMEHLRRLQEHASQTFGDDVERLLMRETAVRFGARPNDPASTKLESEPKTPERAIELARIKARIFPTAEAIHASVRALGHDRLRFVCLWYSDDVRQRMLKIFNRAFNLDLKDTEPGAEIPLAGDKISATFIEAPDFLRHGPAAVRPSATKVLPEAAGGELLAAWCETEMSVPDDEEDAKTHTSVMLARAGVPNQYLVTREGKRKPKADALGFDDHPAQAALLDLFRSLGIVDDRISGALATKEGASGFASMAHIGIRVRKQSRRPGEKGSPKYVVTASALVPPAREDEPWRLLGWSLTGPTWQPYHRAQTDFHARQFPPASSFQRDDEQWSEVRRLVDQALEDLADDLDDVPYTVTVDAEETRRIWPGLQNSRLDERPDANVAQGWLPGASLDTASQPCAIVRLNTSSIEMPKPTAVSAVSKEAATNAANGESAGSSKQATARSLYRLTTDFGSPAWYLCSVPVQFDGGQRVGEKYTRWSARNDPTAEMRQNWYTMNATEIFPVANRSDLSDEGLVAGIAKLCHQTLYWTNRAKYPVPLHAAAQMDLDHPQYRRTIAPETPDDDILDEPDDEWPETLF